MGVASTNLTTLERVLDQIPSLADGDSDTLLNNLIKAASGVIETYCRRQFKGDTYDELLDGTGTPYLYVNNPPIRRVVSIRTGLIPAIFIQNNDPTNLTQFATVDVTSTAVVLSRTYNNATTTTTFTFASKPTIGALATAINAVGSGWQATVPSNFALWQTADLNVQAGSYSARNISTALPVYWFGLPYFKVNEQAGEIYNPGGFVQGYQAYRTIYDGGFLEIPEDLQAVTAEMVQLMYSTRTSNPLMQSETIDRYTYTRAAQAVLDNLGLAAKLVLNSYKLLRVARYK